MYTLSQWVLFFFIYSLIGWIWESCLVSCREKRWVNRGFLNGSILPIYGFGAIAILLSTIEVQDNVVLIFIFGMIGADILEYFTGAIMYKIFHVKYWDYSRFKYNLNGYISLQSSLCWGVFSIILVKIIHVPIAEAVGTINPYVTEILAVAMMSAFSIDTAISVREALDLKKLLVHLDESKEQIERLQKRLEVISAVAIDDYHNMLKKAEEKESVQSLIQRIDIMRSIRRENIKQLYNRLEEQRKEYSDYADIKELILREKSRMDERRNDMYKRAAKHLRRNPGAVSFKHKGAFDEMKRVFNEHKKNK